MSPGMRESEAQLQGKQILSSLGMDRIWHPLLIRFGANTLKAFKERSEGDPVLGAEMVNEVLDVMVELAGEGMTMMCVTHEMGFARKVADRIVFMDGGEIIEDVKSEAFFSAPRSDRARNFLSKILQH